jgi:hypothetical protein
MDNHTQKRSLFAILVAVAFGAFHWSAESDCSNTVTATYSNHVSCDWVFPSTSPTEDATRTRATDLKRQSASAHTRRSPTADFQPPRLESIESTRHGRTMASMTASLCAPNRVCPSLGGKRALGSTRALAAARAPARSNSRRSVTTRAVQEIAGADWKKEVLEVRPVTTPPYPRLRAN